LDVALVDLDLDQLGTLVHLRKKLVFLCLPLMRFQSISTFQSSPVLNAETLDPNFPDEIRTGSSGWSPGLKFCLGAKHFLCRLWPQSLASLGSDQNQTVQPALMI
jgi:hypothetical protein